MCVRIPTPPQSLNPFYTCALSAHRDTHSDKVSKVGSPPKPVARKYRYPGFAVIHKTPIYKSLPRSSKMPTHMSLPRYRKTPIPWPVILAAAGIIIGYCGSLNMFPYRLTPIKACAMLSPAIKRNMEPTMFDNFA